ncbi:hypothetical protein XELAEV_18000262mg [Xenopus laevis]|uniref:MHC class I-like antigen recognition-like domain-containing protein n=1 Tax=Xenopus laevis TaxID=8355 RepID=A0A974GZH9_XENLA|nr:hypothetical protein XELAEV_18000262mg [Xenopus laevis]
MVSIVFLLFDLGITAVYCGSDTLKYHVTLLSALTPGVPQYSVIMYVNDVPYGRYNSDERRAQAFTPSLNVLSEHLETQTRIAQEYEIRQRHRMNFLMEILNKSKGDGDIHVYQRKCACELHDDGTIDGYQEIAFDGNLLLIFDKEKVIYLPVTEEAITVAEQWNKLYDSTYAKINTEHECIEQLKIYQLTWKKKFPLM